MTKPKHALSEVIQEEVEAKGSAVFDLNTTSQRVWTDDTALTGRSNCAERTTIVHPLYPSLLPTETTCTDTLLGQNLLDKVLRYMPKEWSTKLSTGLPLVSRKIKYGKLWDVIRGKIQLYSPESMASTIEASNESQVWEAIERGFTSIEVILEGESLFPDEYDDTGEKINLRYMNDELWALGQKGTILPGVTEPSIVINATGAISGWRRNILDFPLCMVNRAGAILVIYSIPMESKSKFELKMKELCARSWCCDQFLRHEDCVINPSTLKKSGIDVTTTYLQPGKGIVIGSGVYHMKLSLGFNVTEEISVCLESSRVLSQQATTCDHDPRKPQWTELAQLLWLYGASHMDAYLSSITKSWPSLGDKDTKGPSTESEMVVEDPGEGDGSYGTEESSKRPRL